MRSHDPPPQLDFSNPSHTKLAVNYIKSLRGVYWFDIRRCQDQRSLNQNRMFHGPVLTFLCIAIREAWGGTPQPHEVKDYVKLRFLGRPLIDHNTGQEKGLYVPSTADLSVEEFAEFLDKITVFAAEELGAEMPTALQRIGA